MADHRGQTLACVDCAEPLLALRSMNLLGRPHLVPPAGWRWAKKVAHRAWCERVHFLTNRVGETEPECLSVVDQLGPFCPSVAHHVRASMALRRSVSLASGEGVDVVLFADGHMEIQVDDDYYSLELKPPEVAKFFRSFRSEWKTVRRWHRRLRSEGGAS